MREHEAADYVSRYAASLEVEVTDEMIVEGLQELMAWEPLLSKCVTQTKSEFSLPKDGFEVETWVHRREDMADTLHAKALMVFEEVVTMLKDEWTGYLTNWFRGALLPAIHLEMQQSRYFQTNRIDRGGGWVEVVDGRGNRSSYSQSTMQVVLDPAMLRNTYTITTTNTFPTS